MVLRRFTESDAGGLLELYGDPEVMRFLTGGRPKPRAVTWAETLPGLLGSYGRFGGLGYWAAVEKATGGFLGWFEFRSPEGGGPGVIELGFRLRRSAWGKGYATEGSLALIRKGFTELGVRRVVAETMAVNAASRRVLERAGLTLRRTFYREWPEPIAGAEHGDVEYALTRAEWEAELERRELRAGRRAEPGEKGGRGAVDPREGWDRTFSHLREDLEDDDPEDPWLGRWRGMLESHRGSPVLDLGCGAGYEARTLTLWGHPVVAADFSTEALELARRRAPEAEVREVDLTRRLPFPDAHFGVVVASLSLHYFPWAQTVGIVEEIRRCLLPGGHLLARLNSTNDARYAAAEKEPVEENFYLVGGRPQRLFDRDAVEALFSRAWVLEEADERTTRRYGGEKTLWEVSARKYPEP